MKIAIIGCAHGELNDMYASIEYINDKFKQENQSPIELAICCGDFQSIRNEQDLQALACPVKYRQKGDFHEYYNKTKLAPVPTIFIGGNHEASNYLEDLHYGGFVAPNIFYLGRAGTIKFGGIRIAGLSGIYKPHDYTAGHFESYPYDNSTMRSVYHVRASQIYQLAHLKQPIDIFLSHDWPRGIEQYGDVQQLLRQKSFFQQEIQSNTLGNPATEYLLHKLQPHYWFSAHLHVKFPAVVRHQQAIPAEAESKQSENKQPCKMTKFLALDKCLRNKDFLQVLDVPRPDNHESPPIFKLDTEWLAILRGTHHLVSREYQPAPMPTEDMDILPEDISWVENKLRNVNENLQQQPLQYPWEFEKTISNDAQLHHGAPRGNPQTDKLLQMLELPHVVTVPYEGDVTQICKHSVTDANEIDIDLDEESAQEPGPSKDQDPNELDIDDI